MVAGDVDSGFVSKIAGFRGKIPVVLKEETRL